MNELEYLQKNIFKGLVNLNTGFDVKTIYYFSEANFEIVLERIEKQGIEILGIEPWRNGEFYDVLTKEDFISSQPNWYWQAFKRFKDRGIELQYAASYKISSVLLDN